MKKISIVIVTYNSTTDIGGCLSSIFENNDLGDALEVIVVDNKSSDISELKTIINQDYPQVILIENDKNGGYGQGNNVGIKAANAPIIMIMNPDVRLFTPIFKDAIDVFKNESCAMLGGHQFESISKLGQSFIPIDSSLLGLLRLKLYRKYDWFNPKYFCFSGACFFIDKRKFEEIGLFDEKIFMYGEEVDLSLRLRASDAKVVYNREIGYIHPLHGRKLSYQSLVNGYLSFLYNHTKHKQNIKKGIKELITYIYLLKIRSYLKKNKTDVQIYNKYLAFLKKEKNKY